MSVSYCGADLKLTGSMFHDHVLGMGSSNREFCQNLYEHDKYSSLEIHHWTFFSLQKWKFCASQ